MAGWVASMIDLGMSTKGGVAMARRSLWAVVVLGALLIAAPLVLGLPSKASAGQDMMDDFRPLMQQSNVDKTEAYYNDVFVPLGDVVPALTAENMAKFNTYVQGFSAMGVDAEKLVPALAQGLNMTTEQVQTFMVAQFPAMTQMLQDLPTMQKDFADIVALMQANVPIFEQVPGGLAHYAPLVATMQANVDTYAEADSLPNMNLFTWFFVVFGSLLIAIGALGLVGTRAEHAAAASRTTRRSWRVGHAATSH
jgi:hypothetical protein